MIQPVPIPDEPEAGHKPPLNRDELRDVIDLSLWAGHLLLQNGSDTARIEECTSIFFVLRYCIHPNATPSTHTNNPIYSRSIPLTVLPCTLKFTVPRSGILISASLPKAWRPRRNVIARKRIPHQVFENILFYQQCISFCHLYVITVIRKTLQRIQISI